MLAGIPATGQGQPGADWPTQPVRYINIFPPGGATDTLSRLYCAKMGEITGQQFVVENRSGSGGTVGVDAIAKSQPDGYTVGLCSIAPHAIAPTLYASLPFDAARDFTFISGLWQLPNLLVVNNDLPARRVPELIALLKASHGKYAYGSSGTGTTPHLSGEMLKQMVGADILHVPYRGGAPALLDLLAGRAHLIMDNIPGLLPTAREGRIRALAVTGPQRCGALTSDTHLGNGQPPCHGARSQRRQHDGLHGRGRADDGHPVRRDRSRRADPSDGYAGNGRARARGAALSAVRPARRLRTLFGHADAPWLG